MSYHRVLPPPPALATQSSNAPWLPRPDSLLQNQIMTDENSKSNQNGHGNQGLASSSAPSSPVQDKASSSPVHHRQEESSGARTRSSGPVSSEGEKRLQRRLPFISKETVNWDSPSSICLCQPDPKVPRPRNAFILYRQHHQAHIVAQNPGLSNPEISKVIGEHWRSSSPEVQKHWKNLAEEEKLRHQRQYPDYRYQPRRNARSNSLSSGSNPSTNPAEADSQRCAKCGGRSMNTPGMILSAGYLASASSAASNSPTTPYSASRPPTTPSTGSSARKFLQGPGSPTSSTTGATTFFHRTRNASNGGVTVTPLGVISPRFKRPEAGGLPVSADAKRRRIQNVPYTPARLPTGPSTPFPFGRRRESLPRPDFMNSQSFSMAPPPRPHPTGHPPESSLVLPPIKSGAVVVESTQAKSVEAMIMSIPVLNKIRQLSQISPPLSNPSPGSPAYRIRGFVVAVDGQESTAVEQVTAYLNSAFTPKYRVRLFQNHFDSWKTDKGRETDSIDAYVDTMSGYHALSNGVKSYITTALFDTTSQLSSPAISPKTNVAASLTGSEEAAISANTSLGTAAGSSMNANAPNPANIEYVSSSDEAIPIALIPRYQLTHTDACASSIPISDGYSPIDHWLWMASMWRGIIGPDITIAVAGEEDSNRPKERVGPDSRGEGKKAKNHDVEIRLDDRRAIIVRVEQGGKVGEGALRRLGFEVEEWIRGRADGRRGS
ncbi:MAG: hypothetical protein Q9190_003529 [Brigantiaea leucoxantha]